MTTQDPEISLAGLCEIYAAVRSDLQALENRHRCYQHRVQAAAKSLPHQQFTEAVASGNKLKQAIGEYHQILIKTAGILESIKYPQASESTVIFRDEEGRISSTKKLIERVPATDPLPPEFHVLGVQCKELLDRLNERLLVEIAGLDAVLES